MQLAAWATSSYAIAYFGYLVWGVIVGGALFFSLSSIWDLVRRLTVWEVPQQHRSDG